MTTYSQSSTNDIETYTIGNKSYFKMADGNNAYATVVADAIRTLTNELQLDMEKGIPWMSTILATANREAIWKHYVEKRIRELEFVSDIVSFDVSYDADHNQVNFSIVIRSKDGEDVEVEDSVFGG